jgi:hypothetical protein
MTYFITRSQSRGVPVIRLAILAGVALMVVITVAVAAVATVVSYFLLAREEGAFTKEEDEPHGHRVNWP